MVSNILIYLLFFSISIVIYGIYIEFSPGMGNILFRKNSNGTMNFTPMNVFRVMVWPFQEFRLWLPSNWDINYWIIGAFPAFICCTVYTYMNTCNKMD